MHGTCIKCIVAATMFWSCLEMEDSVAFWLKACISMRNALKLGRPPSTCPLWFYLMSFRDGALRAGLPGKVEVSEYVFVVPEMSSLAFAKNLDNL